MPHIHFIGDHRDRMLVKSRALADDLARIAAGDGPTPADLTDAPLLDRWLIGVSLQPVLYGSVVDHPRLGTRPAIRTTPVFAIDGNGLWARTWSRYYRLGREFNDAGSNQ